MRPSQPVELETSVQMVQIRPLGRLLGINACVTFLMCVSLLVLTALSKTLASSAPQGIVPGMIEYFGSSHEVGSHTIALLVTGSCVGTIAWPRLGEQWSQDTVDYFRYLLCRLPVCCALSRTVASTLVFRFISGVFSASTLVLSSARLHPHSLRESILPPDCQRLHGHIRHFVMICLLGHDHLRWDMWDSLIPHCSGNIHVSIKLVGPGECVLILYLAHIYLFSEQRRCARRPATIDIGRLLKRGSSLSPSASSKQSRGRSRCSSVNLC